MHKTAVLKYALKGFLYLLAVCGSVMGAHGLVVFLNRGELHSAAYSGKLFYSIPVGPFQPVIEWMSRQGVLEWVVFGVRIPHWVIILIIALSIILWVMAKKVGVKGKAKGTGGKRRRARR